MNLGANLGAGLTQGYSQSGQSSGSVNQSINSAQSYNQSFNDSMSESHSRSWTDAEAAREWSAWAADVAWQRDMEAFLMQMDFNREEAQKQRDWQAEMANTIYTRSVKNMREAGINPILAYRMGLSGANVGSGATASLGGSPSAPLAQNFMDSFSASDSYSKGHGESYGSSWGSGESNGSSWGSGWSNSENGIITALEGLGAMADTAIDGINAGNTLDYLNNLADGNPITNWGNSIGQKIKDSVSNGVKKLTDKIGKQLNPNGGGHGF